MAEKFPSAESMADKTLKPLRDSITQNMEDAAEDGLTYCTVSLGDISLHQTLQIVGELEEAGYEVDRISNKLTITW